MSNVQSSPRLGVDLGTLSITAAVHADAGGVSAPAIVAFGEAGQPSSSAVAITTDGFVVGAAAEQIIAMHPDHGTHELKRRFGDQTPLVLDGHPYGADTLTVELLRSVVGAAGIDPGSTALTLTHPPSWREYKLELLADVAAQAGFTDVELVSEPVAAARHCANTGVIAAGDAVAIYNFGATFDATIVNMAADGPQIVGTPQDLERIGGSVFDQVVFGHVVETLGGAVQQLDRNDPAVHTAIVNLRAQCTAAKERLSTAGEATVTAALPGLDTQVRMTRDEFEAALRPHITETLNALDRALASAEMKPTDLRGVVLTGGTSRIPLVAEMIAGHLGRPVLDSGDPQCVVALGAACGPASTRAPASNAATPSSPSIANAASTILISAAPTPSVIPKETPMSDQPTSTSGASADQVPAAAAGGGRSTPPPPSAPTKGGPSKAAKIAGGVAAAAAAVAGGLVFGDDIVDAVTGDDGDNVAQAAGMPTNQPQRNEREGDGGNDSMDAFQASPSAAIAGQATTAAPVQGPLGTPLSAQVAAAQESASAFATQTHSAPQAQTLQQDPVHHQAQQQQQQQHVASAPADASMASAGIGADAAGGGAAPAPNADFEAARATLLARLDNFQAPAGTSPEDAAALKQDLQDAIEHFQPATGQSTQDALASLRDDYDQRVQDFTQDQKIDALVREVQRDNAAEDAGTSAAASTADPAAGTTPVPPAAAGDDATAATDDATGPAATGDPGTTDATGAAAPDTATGDPGTTDASGAGTATGGPVGETVTPATEGFSRFAATGLSDVTERLDVSAADLGVAGDDTGAAGEDSKGGGAAEAQRDAGQEQSDDGGAATGAKGDESASDGAGGPHSTEQEQSDAGGAATGAKGDDSASGADDGPHSTEQEQSDASGDATGAKSDESANDDAGGAHSTEQEQSDDAGAGRMEDSAIDMSNVTVSASSHVLVDDFDGLTATGVTSTAAVDIGQVDGSAALQQPAITVTDVRASLPDGPRPVMVVDDVVGDSTYAGVVEETAVVIDVVPSAVGEANLTVSPNIVVDPAPVLPVGADDGNDGNDGNVTVEVVTTADAFGATLTPTDGDSRDFADDDDVDFATDIASDITPNSPTDLNFGP